MTKLTQTQVFVLREIQAATDKNPKTDGPYREPIDSWRRWNRGTLRALQTRGLIKLAHGRADGRGYQAIAITEAGRAALTEALPGGTIDAAALTEQQALVLTQIADPTFKGRWKALPHAAVGHYPLATLQSLRRLGLVTLTNAPSEHFERVALTEAGVALLGTYAPAPEPPSLEAKLKEYEAEHGYIALAPETRPPALDAPALETHTLTLDGLAVVTDLAATFKAGLKTVDAALVYFNQPLRPDQREALVAELRAYIDHLLNL